MAMENQVEHNMEEGELKRHTDQDACSMCGNLCKTRCSRCKVARYWVCQIKHWRSRHKYECIHKENTEDQVIKPAHEAPECKLLNKDKMGEMGHEQTKERIRNLEEELVKSIKEIKSLKSERDNWKIRTEFVSKRLHSFMKESDQDEIAVEAKVPDMIKQKDYIKMLKSELQTERECAQRLTLELEETAQSAIIKIEEAKVAEMRKQEKYIKMMMMRRNLQEERKHKEAKQIAMNKVREIGQDLVNARNDLASAISRAQVAEEKLSDLERKLKLTDDKYVCAICLNNEKDMAFSCGHMNHGHSVPTASLPLTP
ncbi:hypothetical protein VNO77_39008 [Canavalia gladiata]|uniref:MYND-type domain-containing protein n=1 Tax=Canavalia gladiata TaxID=3824 RepID=A0AAN9PWR0_CANGL